MLSRVADSIYWLGRYLERAENYARFIDVNFNLIMDLPPGFKEQWQPLIAATGDKELFEASFKEFDKKNALFFLTFDERNPNSLLSCVFSARENARIVRENLSKETWEKLNETYLMVKEGESKKIWLNEDPSKFFTQVKYNIQLLYGIADNSVARTEGWYFSQLGQLLERADKTSRILDVKYHILLPEPDQVGSPLDFLHWMALLKSVSGFNTYRRIYGNIDASNVVEFLVLDKYFPRSIFYCLTEAERCLHRISGNQGKGYTNSAEKAIGSLRAHLEYADINDVFQFGLHEYLDQLQVNINQISEAIYSNFFEIKDTFGTEIKNRV